MNLYQIDAEIQETLDSMVDPETGEISDDSLSILVKLESGRESKIENIALYIKNLSAKSSAIKAEEETLYKRRKSAENHASRLKKYLSDFMPGETMEMPRVKIGWRKSPQVHIENESDFILMYKDSDFLTYKAPTINKTNIGNALKAGDEVKGAKIVTAQHIQIK